MRNLHALGVTDIVAYDPSELARTNAVAVLPVKSVAALDELWGMAPDVAFVTSPTALHSEHALEGARRGIHLFVEKPLSHTWEGVEAVLAETQKNGLITMVGCNMRFHPGPAKVKEKLNQNGVGRVLSARIEVSSWLPGWRPHQDYRQAYSASQALGGGCILDCIHEIDLARWYLGEVSALMCMADHVSSLEMDVEDVAAIICRHESGAISEIHLDYVRRPASRSCEITGENGVVSWRLQDRKAQIWDGPSGNVEEYEQAAGWEANNMYLDEVRHFLECVRAGRETVCSVTEAAQVLRIALAAKVSALEGRLVRRCRKTGAFE